MENENKEVLSHEVVKADISKIENKEKDKPLGLVVQLAKKYGLLESDAGKLSSTLKATCFKQKKSKDAAAPVITNEQLMMLLIVANRYNLNPFVKEIYAFPDREGIVPVIGVDGWSNLINSHPQLDGIEFVYSDNIIQNAGAKACPEWVECIITRKDRAKPIVIREYLDECYKTANYVTPWQSHTKRFLRHKALIQCARVAFGFTGIYDEDEASNIIAGSEAKDITPKKENFSDLLEAVKADVKNINSIPEWDQSFREIKPKIASLTPEQHSQILSIFIDRKQSLDVIDVKDETENTFNTKDVEILEPENSNFQQEKLL